MAARVVPRLQELVRQRHQAAAEPHPMRAAVLAVPTVTATTEDLETPGKAAL